MDGERSRTIEQNRFSVKIDNQAEHIEAQIKENNEL